LNIKIALDIFSTSQDKLNKEDLKSSYRSLAKSRHPDHGGSNELMIELNDAYELLLSKVDGRNRLQDWRERDEKEKQELKELKSVIETKLNSAIDSFMDHLKGVLGGDEEISVSEISGGFNNVNISFMSTKKRSYFTLTVFVRSVRQSMMIGDENTDFEVTIVTDIFHNNKKIKLAQKTWKSTTDHSSFLNPEKLFPASKCREAFAKNANREPKKSDFETMLRSFGNVNVNSDTYHLYFDNGYRIVLYRLIYRREGAWYINGVYKGPGGQRLPISFSKDAFVQSSEGIELLLNELMRLKAITDEEALRV
jgi:hypothetical protein